MELTTLFIIIVFVVGYVCIAIEDAIKVTKSATALLMCAITWTLYSLGTGDGFDLHALGDTSQTIFFLMGAMTIVEVVDQQGGFNFVRDALSTRSKRSLLWRIAFMTFFLSALLDNLTTSIVMIMVLRKLVADHKDRIIYAALIVISANAGGAWSPIGDVTTIMLWINKSVTSLGVMKEIIIPSLIAMIVPALILQFQLKGDLQKPQADMSLAELDFSKRERDLVFWIGVGGLVFVPIFHSVTNLPPFMGILLALSMIWIATELLYSRKKQKNNKKKKRVAALVKRIDMSTLLFFLGILLTVTTLEKTHVLENVGIWLNNVSNGNHYLVTGVIGVLSSIVDNVPLVACCMKMYAIDPNVASDFAQDGIFWQLLAYCAGVGGSMLIIGSAAGVVVMGLEKISFGWYMRKITWIAFVGYIAGIAYYWLERSVLGL
ncbi:sodium:proton antiporter [Pseudoprevotella muciniphila]|uniref:Sodium:proton antiporter n=1 Tax=Pseudoprevotella muciniphila TaxID=2133944 RepID=A0A5P8E759_9BACT|nr:sodium:proton antiporter NhaD [Pseudoprevotella muciniphila]QFQ12776.1 sodium:proton antiporter [Pseudoprevotella muciniphila]